MEDADRHHGGSLPPAPLQQLPPDIPDGTARSVGRPGTPDVDPDGAADALLWADAIRLGFVDADDVGPDARRGFGKYLRSIGVMSDDRAAYIERNEFTNWIFDEECNRDCGD